MASDEDLGNEKAPQGDMEASNSAPASPGAAGSGDGGSSAAAGPGAQEGVEAERGSGGLAPPPAAAAPPADDGLQPAAGDAQPAAEQAAVVEAAPDADSREGASAAAGRAASPVPAEGHADEQPPMPVLDAASPPTEQQGSLSGAPEAEEGASQAEPAAAAAADAAPAEGALEEEHSKKGHHAAAKAGVKEGATAAVPALASNSDGRHSQQAPKETAAERLTTPTAMRMLKQLQQAQGGKAEWHIATGVAFKSKKLSSDEMASMVDRLCKPKLDADNLLPKPHAVKLMFEGNKEVLVPVKESTKDDNIAFMSGLYERCKETRAKTLASLQEKWLQPLGPKPKQQHTSTTAK